MRSSLPVFIFVGLALVAVVGMAMLGAASTAAVKEVNNTSTEELPLAIYETNYGLVFGISALLILMAGYFALKLLT